MNVPAPGTVPAEQVAAAEAFVDDVVRLHRAAREAYAAGDVDMYAVLCDDIAVRWTALTAHEVSLAVGAMTARLSAVTP